MNRRIVIAVVVAATIGVLVTPNGMAAAQPAPDEPVPTVPDDPPDEPEPTTPPPPSPAPLPDVAPAPPGEDEGPYPSGESMIPTLPGDVLVHPTRNYDIGYDAGAWNHFDRKFFGSLTAIGWLLNQTIVAVVLWFTGWAFGFDLIGPIKEPILSVAATWNQNLIGPLGLNEFAWFILMTYVAAQVWRGRAMNALGEFIVSVIALGVTVVISANPGGYLDGAERTLQQVSSATMAVSRGEQPSDDPNAGGEFVASMQRQLHAALIEEPYEVINWGGPLAEPCSTVADDMVADGPWGAKDDPRNAMTAAGCDDEADFNHDPTADRMAGAWMAALVSGVVLILLLFAVITMMMASLFFVLRFAWLPFALLGFQLPGAARELAWGWLVGLLKNGGVVAGMSFVISYLLMLISAFLSAPGMSVAERFSVVVILSVSMFLYRRQILRGIDHVAERIRSELGLWRPGLAGRGHGGLTGSGASAGVAGLTGYGVGQRAREATLDVPGSKAYQASHMGRRFEYQTTRHRRHGGRTRRGYRQRMRAGSALDLG